MIISYQVEKSNISINDYLLEKQYSKKLISALKYQGGEILVFTEAKNVEYILKENDILTVKLPKEVVNQNIIKTKMNLDIVYEDEYFLIINKEAGVPTIPSKRHYDCSLASGVANYYDELGVHANIHFVNRLDKDTSGLVIVAKNRYIHHLFDNYVNIEKKYLALVMGNFKEDIIIEQSIKRESEEKVKRVVDISGDYAKTGVRLIKQYSDYSLVELTLFTGRTHQIRVHLSYLNHPLLGDELYGGNKTLIDRQALHSHYLKFDHPITKILLEIKKEPPKDMTALIK